LFLRVFQVTDSPFVKRFKTFCLFDKAFLPLVSVFLAFVTTLKESFANNDLNIQFTPSFMALIKVTNFASISNYPKVLYGILKIFYSQ
jgi:hypothetical protein